MCNLQSASSVVQKSNLWRGVSLQHDNATGHTARWTRTAAAVSLETFRPSTMLSMSLKRHLEGRLFYGNEELEMAVREWMKMQKSGINVLADRLKIMTSGVKKQSYTFCCSMLFSFNVLHISFTKDY